MINMLMSNILLIIQVELMKETYERCVEIEDKKGGLIIMKALYGKLLSSDDGYVCDVFLFGCKFPYIKL